MDGVIERNIKDCDGKYGGFCTFIILYSITVKLPTTKVINMFNLFLRFDYSNDYH